jgi:hypothetical protein
MHSIAGINCQFRALDGLRVIQVIEAVIESNESKKRVALP